MDYVMTLLLIYKDTNMIKDQKQNLLKTLEETNDFYTFLLFSKKYFFMIFYQIK